jgi:hypothetical protein
MSNSGQKGCKVVSSSALPIVEEFLRSSEPQHRKNALTALTVIGDQESVKIIAETALNDGDAGVRMRAVDKILSLDEKSMAGAMTVLSDALKGAGASEQKRTDREKQERANALLGQLGSRGISVPEIGLPLVTRMRLAMMLNRYIYPVKGWDYHLRTWKAGLAGSAVGVVLALLGTTYFFFLSENGSAVLDPLFVLLLIVATGAIVVAAMIVAVCATQLTIPINCYLSRLAALPVEVLIPSVLGFAGAFSFYLLLDATLAIQSALSSGYGNQFMKPAVIILLVFIGLLAGGARCGTILSFGIYDKPKLNWLAEVLAGTTAGFAITGSLLLLLRLEFGLPSEGLWIGAMASLPFALACANAFASVDHEFAPVQPMRGDLGSALRVLLFPTLVVINLLMAFFLVIKS